MEYSELPSLAGTIRSFSKLHSTGYSVKTRSLWIRVLKGWYMVFSGKKTKIHSNCLTSFYRFYHAFTEHVIFSHDRDHDMFIYCSTFSLMTLYCLVYSGLATPLHHLSWRCHCKCFPFHYFPRLEFPLFPDWKFPAAELLAAQSISQTDVPLKRRKKGLSLALCGIEDPIKQSWIKVLFEVYDS